MTILEYENRRLKERVEELCELYANAKDDCRKLEDKIAVLEGRVEPDYPGLAEFELANEQGYSEHDPEAFHEMQMEDMAGYA